MLSRREAELLALGEIAADPAVSILVRAAALLVKHQRREAPGGCICGWNVLGAMHARHQAAELADAGLLLAAAETTGERSSHG